MQLKTLIMLTALIFSSPLKAALSMPSDVCAKCSNCTTLTQKARPDVCAQCILEGYKYASHIHTCFAGLSDSEFQRITANFPRNLKEVFPRFVAAEEAVKAQAKALALVKITETAC